MKYPSHAEKQTVEQDLDRYRPDRRIEGKAFFKTPGGGKKQVEGEVVGIVQVVDKITTLTTHFLPLQTCYQHQVN